MVTLILSHFIPSITASVVIISDVIENMVPSLVVIALHHNHHIIIITSLENAIECTHSNDDHDNTLKQKNNDSSSSEY